MQKWFFAGSSYGGCRYYRQVLPIRHLGRRMMEQYNVRIKLGRDLSEAMDADVLFFSRNIGADMLSYIARLKAQGKVIVWDMDDDLSIPERWQNPNLGYVMREISALECCLDMADVITVSTEGLKAAIGRPEKTTVVPNAICQRDWWFSPHVRSKRILYAGTPTHRQDLELVKSLYQATNRDYQWVFFGCDPGWRGTRSIHIPLTSINDYPGLCRTLRPEFCLAPLQPCRFNESKSPIKAWEMATAGGFVVASDTGPYRGHPAAVVPEGQQFGAEHLAHSDDSLLEQRLIACSNSWQNEKGEARTRCMNVFEYVYFTAAERQSGRSATA